MAWEALVEEGLIVKPGMYMVDVVVECCECPLLHGSYIGGLNIIECCGLFCHMLSHAMDF